MKNIYLIIFLALLSVNIISCNNSQTSAVAANTQNSTDTFPSWAIVPFTKVDSANPVLTPGNNFFTDPIRHAKVYWENKDVFNPALVVRHDTVFMLYRAQDSIGKPAGTSRVGLAVSTDGLHFTRMPAPVLYPDNDAYKIYEWEGGCEDPRVVQDSAGTYYMTYTAYDGKQARLLIATSTDLTHWQKHGPAFANAYNGKYKDIWSKSGSIVSVYTNGEPTAAKINGKYWMFWGDNNIWMAVSDDLINWSPVEKDATDTAMSNAPNPEAGATKLKPVIKPRLKKFDSQLCESGPPAILTDKGIVLMYNGMNQPASTGNGDSTVQDGAYTSCQVLLDKNDPTKVVDRMEHYFMRPEKPYEITGQVNQVCFIEGLVQFKNKWWLYYGTADSKIAVAVK